MPPRTDRPGPVIDPKIAEHLIIRDDLVIPPEGSFRGFISQEDLEGLEKRDKRTILRMSAQDQWLQWFIERHCELYDLARHIDYERAKAKLDLKLMREERREYGWSILKWFAITLGAGLISRLLAVWIK